MMANPDETEVSTQEAETEARQPTSEVLHQISPVRPPPAVPEVSPATSSAPALTTTTVVPEIAESPSESGAEESEDTPVTHERIAGDERLTAPRPWRAPDFSNQTQALGWSEQAFAIPKGLEANVSFWIDIYTRYSTDQGLIHDSEYIDLVYEVLDFSSIVEQKNLDAFQKERMRSRQVKAAKKRVMDLLKKFETLRDPSGLEEHEKRAWDYFQKIEDPKKFKKAQSRNRTRFQLGQRDRVIQGIFFSGRYLEEFERIFRDANLPIELTRMVFVESSFNVLARSKVGASGLWQIMRYTGRPYMMINEAIDKRNHPVEATKLAAKLLRNNYDMLQAWPLAVTGYNHGPSGVLRLTKLHKSRDLSDLFPSNARRRLGFASRNFYPSFLAILEVERNAPKHFGNILWSQPLAAHDVKIPFEIKYVDVLRWFDGDDQRAQIFNPQINQRARQGKIALPKGAIISVPASKQEQVAFELSDKKNLRRVGVR